MRVTVMRVTVMRVTVMRVIVVRMLVVRMTVMRVPVVIVMRVPVVIVILVLVLVPRSMRVGVGARILGVGLARHAVEVAVLRCGCNCLGGARTRPARTREAWRAGWGGGVSTRS